VKGKAKVLGHHQSTDKPIASERVCWEPPSEGWVKINSDAGFDETSGEASAGISIRDAYGGVMLSAWQIGAELFFGIQLGAEWQP
jgi:hypothetical protein